MRTRVAHKPDTGGRIAGHFLFVHPVPEAPAAYAYDAFGNLFASTGTPARPFGFVGSEGYQEDPDSGLKLLGHRY